MLLTIFLLITLLNGFLLEKYYLSRKVDVILDARSTLEQVEPEDLSPEYYLGDESTDDKKDGKMLRRISKGSSQNNLSWVVINAGNSEWYNWGENEDFLRSRLFGYIYNLGGESSAGSKKIIREAERLYHSAGI